MAFSVLPKTCLVMSVPLIKGLKSMKHRISLFDFIPSKFFKPIIDIFVYTFGESQKDFDQILETFNYSFSYFYEKLEDT